MRYPTAIAKFKSALPCTGLSSLGRRHSDAPAFNSEQQAESATWRANPGSGNWNAAANWTPATIPNGTADIATFAFSNITRVFFAADTEVNGIVFNAGASPFTLINQAPTVTISGTGITNNSGIVHNFTPGPGQIIFTNSARAGSLTSFTNTGAIAFAGSSAFSNDGELTFLNTSTAGDATFINEGGKVSSTGGATIVFDIGPNARNALITTNVGAVSGALNAETLFRGNAGDATLIANGGSGGAPGESIRFLDTSSGGTAHSGFRERQTGHQRSRRSRDDYRFDRR